MAEEYNIVFSFDTTGSMSGCLGQVRNSVEKTIQRLFDVIPTIKIGLIAHGDYCDEHTTYLMKKVDITNDKQSLIDFVKNVGSTGGGDFPEAYEYVLRESRKLNWCTTGVRSLVMIGDAVPHEKNSNPEKIEWREEVEHLRNQGVNIYSIQCMKGYNKEPTAFYRHMATETNGLHLYLHQLAHIVDIMIALCLHCFGNDRLEKFETDLNSQLGGMTPAMRQMFDVLLKRTTIEEVDAAEDIKYDWGHTAAAAPASRKRKAGADLSHLTEEELDKMLPCAPARFQLLNVTEDIDIKTFILNNGVTFKPGRGFYQFTKPETISKTKEIILQEKTTGLLFEGMKARKMLNLITYDEKAKIKPADFPDYNVFVQSTSYNRVLKADTQFLYDASEEA